MAEELALEEGVGDRGAVDLHEGFAGALAPGVDRAGHELLAGAVLARDEDARVARCGLLDEGAYVGEGGRAADDGLGLEGGGRCALQVAVFAAQLADLEGVARGGEEAVHG